MRTGIISGSRPAGRDLGQSHCVSDLRNHSFKQTVRAFPWWRREMKTFSVLLAHCGDNPPVTGRFPSQRVSNVFVMLARTNCWTNAPNDRWSETPWRSYDFIVMCYLIVLLKFWQRPWLIKALSVFLNICTPLKLKQLKSIWLGLVSSN